MINHLSPVLSIVSNDVTPVEITQITQLIIHMKKLLDSDWLRHQCKKCNTGAKSVIPVQITHRNSGL